MENNAIIIRKGDYTLALKKHKEMLQLQEEIKKEVENLLGKVHKFKDEIYSSMSAFYQLVEAKYKKTNTMKLRGSKLAELHDIDTYKLFLLINSYKDYDGLKKPDITDFTEYAINEQEQERLSICQTIIKTVEQAKKLRHVYGWDLVKGFNNMIAFDTRDGSYHPNLRYVKDTMR